MERSSIFLIRKNSMRYNERDLNRSLYFSVLKGDK